MRWNSAGASVNGGGGGSVLSGKAASDGLGCDAGALRVVVQRCRAKDVPLLMCAQDAAFGVGSEYAYWVFVQDGGGLDRPSTQSGRGTRHL